LGAAIVTGVVAGLFMLTFSWLNETLVEETLVALALVRLAFLLAARLLIKDFFWIDIACSSFF
jgi:hypothetical protein